MLELMTEAGPVGQRNLQRRDFLRIGSLGVGGLSLANLLEAKARAGIGNALRDKAIVVLFLSGGPSHIETFDPHMDAPEGVRSVNGEISTSIPGITFGSNFPLLAARAKKLTVVRSFTHKVADHAQAIQHVLTAGNPTNAGMSAIYARIRGASDPATALPTTALVATDEVDGQYKKENARVRVSSGAGPFGSSYAPFEPSQAGGILDLMRLSIPRERFESRRALLTSLDEARRAFDNQLAVSSMGRYEQSAMELILKNAGNALDLSREDPRLVESYDTSHIQVGHARMRSCTLGKQMLMARRLVEIGCGFVTVHNAGWDMHADVNNPGIEAGMNRLGPPVDKAVAAFLDDLDARGLSRKVLLVITGDFGRTPKINKKGGRDHWSALSTLALAGGGLNMGQVIGRSNRQAERPASDPVTPCDLMATLMKLAFDLPELRLQTGVPREITTLLEAGRPIPGLFQD